MIPEQEGGGREKETKIFHLQLLRLLQFQLSRLEAAALLKQLEESVNDSSVKRRRPRPGCS